MTEQGPDPHLPTHLGLPSGSVCAVRLFRPAGDWSGPAWSAGLFTHKLEGNKVGALAAHGVSAQAGGVQARLHIQRLHQMQQQQQDLALHAGDPYWQGMLLQVSSPGMPWHT